MEQFGRVMCGRGRRRLDVYGSGEVLRYRIHRYAFNLSWNRAFLSPSRLLRAQV